MFYLKLKLTSDCLSAFKFGAVIECRQNFTNFVYKNLNGWSTVFLKKKSFPVRWKLVNEFSSFLQRQSADHHQCKYRRKEGRMSSEKKGGGKIDEHSNKE